MKSLLGDRPVVLHLWISGQQSKYARLPELQRFHEKYGDRILVLAADVGTLTLQSTPRQGKEYLQGLGASFPERHTESFLALTEYGTQGLPTTIFLRSDGTPSTIRSKTPLQRTCSSKWPLNCWRTMPTSRSRKHRQLHSDYSNPPRRRRERPRDIHHA